MLQELSEDLGNARSNVIGLTQKSVKARIAETLLNLKAFYGEDKDTEFLSKKISRTHIAQLCGVTIESVVRTLKSLEREGVITLVKREIRIIDSLKLVQLAGVEF